MKFYMTENGLRTEFDFGELDISGNEDYGFRPFQLFVSSIAGCSGSVLRKIFQKQRVEIDDLTIMAEVFRNEREANRIEKIALKYVIKGKHLDPDRIEKNLEIARKNCSMIRSVEDSIEIDETFELIQLSM